MIRTALVAGLALAMVSTGIVWAASHLSLFQTSVTGCDHALVVTCYRGSIELAYFTEDIQREPGPWLPRLNTMQDEVRLHGDLWQETLCGRFPGALPDGSFSRRAIWRLDLLRTCVRFPIWLPSAVFAAYPAVALIRGPLRRRRRRRRNQCVHCGYNLTGLPEQRCPECGAAV
jgi:hypothetical protein